MDDKETSILYCGPESDKINQEISEDLLATTPKEAMEIAKENESRNREDLLNAFSERIKVITELQTSIQ